MDSLELQDWEVLTHSDLDAVLTDNPTQLEEIEADSGGMIRLDYFSLANDSMSYNKAAVIAGSDVEVESSVGSNNPSWIDPATDVRYESKNPCGFWSDSGSDRSDGRKVSDFGMRTEFMGAEETEAKDVVKDEFSSCQRKTEVKSQLGFEEVEENKTKEKDLSNDYCDGRGNDSVEENSSIVEGAVELKPDVEEVKKQVVVWWKVPLELLKFCVFRVSPVWTFSMAAAVMGFVVLGRRLYNMKRKAKSLQLKVTVDDKKVSQFMSRAARLNEAFSVARRVPIVRPMLPAAGTVNPWPVMNMR